MCGIVTVTGPNASKQAGLLMDAIHHRGPDHSGMSAFSSCALAMTRLAIQDPEPRSSQPMTRKNHTLVFNGEIYNFRELRSELEKCGTNFETTGDTEVVLQAYLQWGDRAFARFRGMFAVAIWNDDNHTLTVARDRYGIKPLYWCHVSDHDIALASEISPLQDLQDLPVDTAAVAEFLAYGSCVTRNVYRDIYELRPGAILKWTGNTLLTSRFVNDESTDHHELAPIDALKASIERHLISDRPVAVFLSGGFDSVTTLAGAVQYGIRPLAITLATDHNQADVDRAREAAQHYGVEQHIEFVTEAEAISALDDYFCAMDQPTIDGFNTYLVCRVAHRLGYPVALSGLGGDEVLGGYGYYQNGQKLKVATGIYNRMPRAWQERALPLLACTSRRPVDRLDRVLSARTPAQSHRAFRTLFSDTDVAALMGDDATDHLEAGWMNRNELQTTRRQLAELDFDLYLRPTLLRDSDVFSMWHSVELRVPLIDVDFVESVMSQPAPPTKLELAGQWGDDYLVQVAQRPKLTFALPWQHWLGSAVNASPLLQQSKPWQDIIKPDVANEMLSRTLSDPFRPWALLVLARWLDSRKRPRRARSSQS
jgi:asparagine synthase (glutamine-hydrolysing)